MLRVGVGEGFYSLPLACSSSTSLCKGVDEAKVSCGWSAFGTLPSDRKIDAVFSVVEVNSEEDDVEDEDEELVLVEVDSGEAVGFATNRTTVLTESSSTSVWRSKMDCDVFLRRSFGQRLNAIKSLKRSGSRTPCTTPGNVRTRSTTSLAVLTQKETQPIPQM